MSKDISNQLDETSKNQIEQKSSNCPIEQLKISDTATNWLFSILFKQRNQLENQRPYMFNKQQQYGQKKSK
ncbi:hypothetical protein TTHERM_00554470 (macronuclear) [Tetrahymena thermophila SB210]|uniref:Uncharacterized protein n=1 Tax=Tetrahymena thermophila (strain SB210) TaxID=312017 RepID=Q22UH8_TETTS|nr:hypothetical protein TTHERM_00554470 [Tetrahymena thermophila SB210]EAR88992.1 hypothetical protein TTHERM_00554470 [Tetrahymena thermophila SB210]|eukprot:XP_001009237.1 hypothetical protein TTHERM_00554470 [Tetrahymena thermophila SB210]